MTDYTGLTQQELEQIERVIYKNGDDVAVSIARGFERLEERIDAAESRLFTQAREMEERLNSSWQDTHDAIHRLRNEIREKNPSPEVVESVD